MNQSHAEGHRTLNSFTQLLPHLPMFRICVLQGFLLFLELCITAKGNSGQISPDLAEERNQIDIEEKPQAEVASVHRIRITLTSRNVRSLEKVSCSLLPNSEGLWGGGIAGVSCAETIAFLCPEEKIILSLDSFCTGARPNLIEEHPHLIGIRDTESVQEFQTRIKDRKRIVLVGNGGIASEIAYASGIINHISSTFLDPGAAEFFKKNLQEKGSSVWTQSPGFRQHSLTLECDFVVSASGVNPRIDYTVDSPLERATDGYDYDNLQCIFRVKGDRQKEVKGVQKKKNHHDWSSSSDTCQEDNVETKKRRSFRCESCSRSYIRFFELTKHKKRHHGVEISGSPEKTTSGLNQQDKGSPELRTHFEDFQCSICSKTFQKKK
uniref:C2H2-type domain-containing protein n=2 Tax=Lutzomyia longipalpis TaxID=7200 RepID=A0A1B0CY37_LUTLO